MNEKITYTQDTVKFITEQDKGFGYTKHIIFNLDSIVFFEGKKGSRATIAICESGTYAHTLWRALFELVKKYGIDATINSLCGEYIEIETETKTEIED